MVPGPIPRNSDLIGLGTSWASAFFKFPQVVLVGSHAGELLDSGDVFVLSLVAAFPIYLMEALTPLEYIIFSLDKTGVGGMLFPKLGKA